MKYPHSIPLWRASGELLSGNASSRVVLSSVGTKWNDVVVEQHDFSSIELADVMFKRHVIAINIGHSFTNEFKKQGRFQRVFKEKGTISFFSEDQTFSCQVEGKMEGFADFAFLDL